MKTPPPPAIALLDQEGLADDYADYSRRLFSRAIANIRPEDPPTKEELAELLARQLERSSGNSYSKLDRQRVRGWLTKGEVPFPVVLAACDLAGLTVGKIEEMEREVSRREAQPARPRLRRRSQVSLQVHPGALAVIGAFVLTILVALSAISSRSSDPRIWLATAGGAVHQVTDPTTPNPHTSNTESDINGGSHAAVKAAEVAPTTPATIVVAPAPTATPTTAPAPPQPLLSSEDRALLRDALAALKNPAPPQVTTIVQPPAPAPPPTPTPTPTPDPSPSPSATPPPPPGSALPGTLAADKP